MVLTRAERTNSSAGRIGPSAGQYLHDFRTL